MSCGETHQKKILSPTNRLVKIVRSLLFCLLLCLVLPLSARSIEEEPLFRELMSIDYTNYTATTEYYYLLTDSPTCRRASLSYTEDYVEYYLEKEHSMQFFLTEQGSLYLLDDQILDITRPSEENLIFAEYLKELQTLLQEDNESFSYEVATIYEGQSELESIPLSWRIKLRTEEETAYLSYTFAFQEGATFTYEATLTKDDLQRAGNLVAAMKAPTFELL